MIYRPAPQIAFLSGHQSTGELEVLKKQKSFPHPSSGLFKLLLERKTWAQLLQESCSFSFPESETSSPETTRKTLYLDGTRNSLEGAYLVPSNLYNNHLFQLYWKGHLWAASPVSLFRKVILKKKFNFDRPGTYERISGVVLLESKSFFRYDKYKR